MTVVSTNSRDSFISLEFSLMLNVGLLSPVTSSCRRRVSQTCGNHAETATMGQCTITIFVQERANGTTHVTDTTSPCL